MRRIVTMRSYQTTMHSLLCYSLTVRYYSEVWVLIDVAKGNT